MRRIIISYGNDFFMNKTAQLLSKYYQVELIQNYVPGKVASVIIRLIDSLLGKKALPRLQGRKVEAKNLISHHCSWNDFYGLICRKMVKDIDQSSMIIAKHFGRSSCRWIKNADIFHVRSGFGQGGAIEKAKAEKMAVIVDHSIAHHLEMENILKPEYERHKIGFTLSSNSKFWNCVVKDCETADAIIVNSEYVKSTFIRNGFDPKKLHVVYLGVREDWFGRKKDYALINNQINLLFVGAFNIRKGAEYVMKAAQLLKTKGVSFKITVIGLYDELQSEFKQYNMENFDFVGMVSYNQLIDYYSTVDAFLFPSLCEGSTRAGMEAMAAGLPVILTENCGCPVRNGDNGLLVPIRDSKAIANAVIELYNSQSLREKLGRNATCTIADKYTWDNYRDNINKVYSKFLI